MLDVSGRFIQTALRGGKLLSRVTCAPPGGEPIELDWTAGSVSCSLSSASRYTAPLRIAPSDRYDVFELVTTPGARFAVDTGFDYRRGASELIGMGRYELAQDGADLAGGDISVDLVDDWAKLERAEYLGTFTPSAGLRGEIIQTAVLEALPTVTVKLLATGGTYTPAADPDPPLSWDSRTKLISDMANDGGLDCYFDGYGNFVIRDEPTINTQAPVWTFRQGLGSNVTAGDRSRPFDRFYNTVVVLPIDESQTWPAQVVEITDPDHPLHKSRYGPAIYKYRSPTLDSAESALAAGITKLQKFKGTPETLSVTSFGMSALEAGDTVTALIAPSATSRGITAFHMLEATTFDLATAGLTASTSSTDRALIEESS
jgi:hypothetical protein